MRITFVIPFASVAGGIRVVATYARILEGRGHDVWVVSTPRRRPPIYKRIRSLLRLQHSKKQAPLAETTLLDFLGSRHLVLDSDRPVNNEDVPDSDVVVATWWRTAQGVASLSPNKGRKFYLIQDYEVFEYFDSHDVSQTFALDMKRIAVSSYIEKKLQIEHNKSCTAVIPNAVDVEQFETQTRVKNDELTVGFLYNRHPRKDVSLAIRSVIAAKEKVPELKVVAFGAYPPTDPQTFPEWIEFHHAPAQSDIPKLYSKCDLWLFTSKSEGFGLPLLEAMACRVPVLATRAGAATDLINGENGTLLDGEVSKFVEEIERFSAMPKDNWQRFSDAAHKTAVGYTWDDATDQLLAAFQSDK